MYITRCHGYSKALHFFRFHLCCDISWKRSRFDSKGPFFFTRNPTGNVPGLVEKRQFFLASNRAGNVSLVATNQKYHQKYIVFLHSWRRPHVLLKIPRFVTINTAGKCPYISSENIWFGCLEHGGEMSWWVVKKLLVLLLKTRLETSRCPVKHTQSSGHKHAWKCPDIL